MNINKKLFMPALCGCVLASTVSLNANATQMVLLDFTSGVDGTINYTQSMRDAVQQQMEQVYSDYDFSFTQTLPTSGDFSTITFNQGNPGGLADGIDFLNQNKSDNAIVNIDGLGFVDQADIISASAYIGAHELGHLQGIRHYDSWAPIGAQVDDETYHNVMASPASVGQPLAAITQPFSLSERSSIKLAYNEQGVAQNEAGVDDNNNIASADALTLQQINVANTSLPDDHWFGTDFDISATAMFGSLSDNDNIDIFAFDAGVNDIFNFEVISQANSNNGSPFDTFLGILDASGNYVDWFGQPSVNDDESLGESFDSWIYDLSFATAGTYYAAVTSYNFAINQQSVNGDYALFISRFGTTAVPAPATFGILLLGLGGLKLFRRKPMQLA